MKVLALSTHDSMVILICLRYKKCQFSHSNFTIILDKSLTLPCIFLISSLCSWHRILLKLQILENAKWIRSKVVLLTHFSSRYNIEVMMEMNQAIWCSFVTFNLWHCILSKILQCRDIEHFCISLREIDRSKQGMLWDPCAKDFSSKFCEILT